MGSAPSSHGAGPGAAAWSPRGCPGGVRAGGRGCPAGVPGAAGRGCPGGVPPALPPLLPGRVNGSGAAPGGSVLPSREAPRTDPDPGTIPGSPSWTPLDPEAPPGPPRPRISPPDTGTSRDLSAPGTLQRPEIPPTRLGTPRIPVHPRTSGPRPSLIWGPLGAQRSRTTPRPHDPSDPRGIPFSPSRDRSGASLSSHSPPSCAPPVPVPPRPPLPGLQLPAALGPVL